ncbi:MAG TPA: hypothetical protein VL359_16985 [bacterium]|nr:hypothetical protein [bacterium]
MPASLSRVRTAPSPGNGPYGQPLAPVWRWAMVAWSIAVAIVLAAALLLGGDQGQARWASSLAFFERPFLELANASLDQGSAGAEYVLFVRSATPEETLHAFFAAHPDIVYTADGILAGVKVVRLRGDVDADLAVLGKQPFVQMTLKSRFGMLCH